MEFARIADPQAREAAAVWADDDIAAARTEIDMAAEVAYIERLITEVDRELADQERIEQVRVTHNFTDHRQARRAHRRAESGVLRALPTRLFASAGHETEAA